MSQELALKRFENWMQAVILSPLGVEGAVAHFADEFGISSAEFESLVPAGPQLSGSARLGIYARMIGLRFMESMDEDFMGVTALLGKQRFRELAELYLSDHPSRAHSLNQLGAGFPNWLAKCDAELEHRELAGELAQLERAILDVYEGPSASSLSVDDLLALPRERWIETRFTPSPSLKLFECSFPANAYLSEVFAGGTPAIPDPAASFVCVHRSNWRVSRTDLTREEYLLLRALFQGVPLAAAFEAALVEDSANFESLMASIGETFENWTAMQFFRSAEL